MARVLAVVCGHVYYKIFSYCFFYIDRRKEDRKTGGRKIARQEEGRLQDSRKTAGQEEQEKSLSLLIWFSYRDFGFSPVRRVRRVQES